MEKEILEKIKQDYIKLKESKEDYETREKRIAELEENELVKEYLELIGKRRPHDSSIALEDKKLMARAFLNHLHEIKETNHIFVYLGTFVESDEIDIVHSSSDIRVPRDDLRAQYSAYQDLESSSCVTIPISNREEFEKENHIIRTTGYFSNREYYDIQDDFAKMVIETSQEEAVEKILSKYIKR